VRISASAFGDFAVGTFCTNDPPYLQARKQQQTFPGGDDLALLTFGWPRSVL
jgi:hypothetical protein